jgi:hypothetical protein
LKALLQKHINETSADHKKGRFSLITNSNLAQAYQRALSNINNFSLPPSRRNYYSSEKDLAKNIILQEIAAYEEKVLGRIGKRQSGQRGESIRKIKAILNRSLSGMDVKDLIELLNEHIKETLIDHKKSFFSWITNSNLAQAYQRALRRIENNSGGNAPGGNGNFPPPPPPPPSPAGASASLVVSQALNQIQSEALRGSFATFSSLRTRARDIQAQVQAQATQRSSHARATSLMEAQPIVMRASPVSSSYARSTQTMSLGSSASTNFASRPFVSSSSNVRDDERVYVMRG